MRNSEILWRKVKKLTPKKPDSVYRYVGILTVESLPSMFRPQLWETSSGVDAVGVFTAETRRVTTPEDVSHSRGQNIEGKESWEWKTPGTSEEDDIDSQDSNTPIDHYHLARNCLIKITTPAVKASVMSLNCLKSRYFKIPVNYSLNLNILLSRINYFVDWKYILYFRDNYVTI